MLRYLQEASLDTAGEHMVLVNYRHMDRLCLSQTLPITRKDGSRATGSFYQTLFLNLITRQDGTYCVTTILSSEHLLHAPPGLMMRVEDVIIKTLLCGVQHISSACMQFQPHRGNCFGEHCTQKRFCVTAGNCNSNRVRSCNQT